MKKNNLTVPVEVSARHIHLTAEHLAELFGEDYELSPIKPLSQPGEFASSAVLDIQTEKNTMKGVRVLGPVRSYSQVEVSRTDSYFLGLIPVIRESGDIKGTPGITLIGPNGTVKLEEGVVLAYRHIHCSSSRAEELSVKHGQFVKARIGGPRAVVYENVMFKVSDNYDWHLHLDVDEGNAAGAEPGTTAEIIF
ncbi:phosphate propanoyltransferase [Candidatus Falkowbacteria bacterium]|nr:phosphate propanoyltransferase [Candidatus Falkowbacteria bacterium]